MLEPSIATLCIGLIIGYVGQRSRMCFVGGLRDFLLVRDTDLLRGLLAFFVTAWLAFSITGFLGLLGGPTPSTGATSTTALQITSSRTLPLPSHALDVASAANITSVPIRHSTGTTRLQAQVGPLDRVAAWFQSLPYSGSYVTLTIIAAFSLGLLSVLANGCPFRQHVLAAQGVSGASFYLLGFYGGILLYDRFVAHWLFHLL